MAVLGKFLKLFMFVGLLVFTNFFFYQLDKSQQKSVNWIQWRQHLRKKRMKEMCEGFSKSKYSVDNMTADMFENFVVDDTHRLIYCYIPKVACTQWKRIMLALKLGKPYPDLLSIDPSVVHGTNRLSYLNDFDTNERMERMENYTKFLFVRDPFSRVVSAFRDKFEYKHLHEYYYEIYGRFFLKRYGNHSNPPRTMSEAKSLGIHPTFQNFVQFLVDPAMEKFFDPHWTQMHRLCHPCLIQYDFVGHQETLKEDAPELLKKLNVANDIKFPPSTNINKTTLECVRNMMNTVPLEDRKKMYKVYEWDFKLFGYRRPKEWLDD
ncbi:carbohydrate sulfotransferase 12 [Nothobranchius furzeri]|uniref:Carbohydrate sulfotransferase n=3 Tax=Nothobranchius furzeri TaxID=105023 RepID=A0A1A8B581_NOTFU|nr:transcript variant X1 [Nothobranchius furzeri]KAF7231498.1 transcript variant X2 [Nothobranchius furzeri]